jgi:hypothetical protein
MSPASTKVAGTKRSAVEADDSENDDNAMNSPSVAASKKKATRSTGAAAKKRKTSGKTSEVGDAIATAVPTVAGKKTTTRKTTTKAKTDTKANGEAKDVKVGCKESAEDGEIKEDVAKAEEVDGFIDQLDVEA